MDEDYFRKIMSTIILGILIVLTFFLLRPILLSVVFGVVLAFVFTPVYNLALKIFKYKNLTAGLISLFLILLIIIPLWFLLPTVIDQSFKVYLAAQQMDFRAPIKSFFLSLSISEEFSAEIGSILYSFATTKSNDLVNYLSGYILNFAALLLNSLVSFFTFFFVLRDKDKILQYIKTLLPFSEDIERKIFSSSKAITFSVIYGQIVVGIVQGLVLGIGLFIFKVPNALLLTVLACVAGILPIIGTSIVFIPVVIYLLVAGSTYPAIGVAIFGILSSLVENVIKPIFVSKRTNMHPLLILLGMIGGLYLFGILGFILGPLILAYILIVLEIYRGKKIIGVST